MAAGLQTRVGPRGLRLSRAGAAGGDGAHAGPGSSAPGDRRSVERAGPEDRAVAVGPGAGPGARFPSHLPGGVASGACCVTPTGSCCCAAAWKRPAHWRRCWPPPLKCATSGKPAVATGRRCRREAIVGALPALSHPLPRALPGAGRVAGDHAVGAHRGQCIRPATAAWLHRRSGGGSRSGAVGSDRGAVPGAGGGAAGEPRPHRLFQRERGLERHQPAAQRPAAPHRGARSELRQPPCE